MTLSLEQVSAVVVDDAPIDYENMTLNCKLLIGNYVKGSIYFNEDELNRYECIPHMTSDYPTAFLLGSEYRNAITVNLKKIIESSYYNMAIYVLGRNGIFVTLI